MRYCEDGEGDARIPAAAYDSDGELDAGAIFCAKCLSKDSTDVRGNACVVKETSSQTGLRAEWTRAPSAAPRTAPICASML